MITEITEQLLVLYHVPYDKPVLLDEILSKLPTYIGTGERQAKTSVLSFLNRLRRDGYINGDGRGWSLTQKGVNLLAFLSKIDIQRRS